jgi:succinoglycan biosynthesis transport protein ExoP
MAAPQNFVSVSRRPPDVEDYIDMMRRYRSWIVGPTFAGLVAAVVVSHFMPDVFVCTAAMTIRPSAVSSTLMPSAVNTQMAQRLSELDLQILGRDNLIMLIQEPKLNLYQKERQRYSVEDVAEDTFRKHVRIQPYEQIGANGAQAFRIIFEYPDKNVARAVVAELVSQFDSMNLSVQAANATKSTTLFEALVKSASEKLDQKQKALADFESANQGKLQQDQQANNFQALTLRQQIDTLNNNISQEKGHQHQLMAQVNTNKSQQADASANLQVTQVTQNQTVTNQNLINNESQINAKQQECVAIEQKYQPDYPDVITCHDQEKKLEQRKEELERAQAAVPQSSATTKIMNNPEVEKHLRSLQDQERELSAQIANSEEQLQTFQKSLAGKTRDLEDVQAKINASPQVSQQYNLLLGDLTMAKEEYSSQSTKQQQAGTQQTMEEHNAGERLDILENPITPEKPASPNRGAWVALGTLIGFVVGVGLAGAKEVKDTSLKNLKDVRAYTNLPVLSSVPLLENALLVRRKRRLAWLAWSTALIVGTILMSASMYYHYVIVPQA